VKKVTICVGTRPNFIKVTQFDRCIGNQPNMQYELVHTGQHFDANMSQVFFEELNLKKPDVFLGAKGDSQIEMMADIMVKFERHLIESKPDLVIVPGDVNSSAACALVASRLGIPLAHLESGLRSFDRHMPEEINRILIDDLSDLFFVTEQSGIDNLVNENKPKENIHFVGNTMIDSLVAFESTIEKQDTLSRLESPDEFALVTFHRPSNVDTSEQLSKLVSILTKVSEHIPLIFSIHPRTLNRLKEFDLLLRLEANNRINCVNSLGYLDFMKLLRNAKMVITDSGGIQEETSFLGVPCLTIRDNTERPITLDLGTNTLSELEENYVMNFVRREISKKGDEEAPKIPLWDGLATKRIVDILSDYLER